MNEPQDFTTWVLLHTQPTTTLGLTRRYNGRNLNVDELYEAWQEFKNDTKTKY